MTGGSSFRPVTRPAAPPGDPPQEAELIQVPPAAFRSAFGRVLVPALAILLAAAPAAALDTSARAALVIDARTGARLMEKNADQRIPPASMSKLMTLDLVFEALAEGRLSLDDTFRVSQKASQMGGSKMFTREGDSIRVEDLLRGVIVQSGNDACVVLAEGLAGSETAFARRMTERGHELGMTGSRFVNATGWPHPQQVMTPEDLVFLARRIITRFPEFYHYFAETEFTWEGITQRNRNPLLELGIGADGLKTGHTEEAGYGLVGSAERDGRRIIFMVAGLASMKDRSLESERLVEWAFREFSNETLYREGQVLGSAEVWLGERGSVPLTVAQDVFVTMPFAAKGKVEASVSYEGPLHAPIAQGQEVARLSIAAPELPPIEVPVIAAETVPMGGAVARLKAAAQLLFRDAMDAVTEAAETGGS
jgi:serine-type D-Ala-D-Ala carboxypeptidase (penicillin-binding protein 5/6)